MKIDRSLREWRGGAAAMDFFSKPLPKSAALPPKDKEEADGSANKKARLPAGLLFVVQDADCTHRPMRRMKSPLTRSWRPFWAVASARSTSPPPTPSSRWTAMTHCAASSCVSHVRAAWQEAAFMAEQEKRLVEATQLLQEHFSTSQLRAARQRSASSTRLTAVVRRQDRYEAYRRSNLKEGTVRKVMNSGNVVSSHLTLAN